jgi:phosphoribosylglycinamide formyltransferase-1
MTTITDKWRVAVLISGSGSNLQSLIDATTAPDYPAKIALVISNVASAYGIQRAQKAGIPATVINHKDFVDRSAFELAISESLAEHKIDYICLAGFMRILTADLVRTWQGRMLNIHPSLLPAFKGRDVHAQTLAAGVTISGCTVHLVTPELDDGPIIVQAAVPVLADDSEDSLAKRILAEEHRIYPHALSWLIRNHAGIAAPTDPIESQPLTSSLIHPPLTAAGKP